MSELPAVVAIVGPTASGKSALAMRVAERFGGEIVSADSRQVYRGMDIGTAKPSVQERRRVPHHMVDVVDAGGLYDVARYQREARVVLGALARRGVRAVVVGGTGLYVRALLEGLDLDSLPTDRTVRAALERRAAEEGAGALHAELARIDPAAAMSVDTRNVRRVVRYLEIAQLAGSVTARLRRSGAVSALKIGLGPPRTWLDAAIASRVRRMVEDGVLAETVRLLERDIEFAPRSKASSRSSPSLTAHGYAHWARHLRGEIDLERAIALTIRDTRAYSRRQMTWFRRDPDIRWVDPTTSDPLDALLAA